MKFFGTRLTPDRSIYRICPAAPSLLADRLSAHFSGSFPFLMRLQIYSRDDETNPASAVTISRHIIGFTPFFDIPV
jgi:hypothetical protein